DSETGGWTRDAGLDSAEGDRVVVRREHAPRITTIRLAHGADDQGQLAAALSALAGAIELVGPLPREDARLQGCDTVSGVESQPPWLEAKRAPVQGCAGNRRPTLLFE